KQNLESFLVIDSRLSTLKTLLPQNTESHSRLPVLGFTPHVHTPTGSLHTGHQLSANCNYPRKRHHDSGAGTFVDTGVHSLSPGSPPPRPARRPLATGPAFPWRSARTSRALVALRGRTPLLGCLGGASWPGVLGPCERRSRMTKVTKEMTTRRLPGRGRQWRASANRTRPVQVLRMAILLSYCSILCNYKAIEMPSHQTYGGSWKFLTFIDL
uniref:Androgen induced 1 n=1 Tax=Pongo abelii TaxID=9601 RepID=A0A8I5TK79_PONAB